MVMIGYIRDEDTSAMACRAALMDRMVLATLHIMSPEGAVPRMLDFGVYEYLLWNVLRGVLGQAFELGDGERRLVARAAV